MRWSIRLSTACSRGAEPRGSQKRARRVGSERHFGRAHTMDSTEPTLSSARSFGEAQELEQIPLARPVLGRAEERAVVEVLRSGRLSLGPRSEGFERAFAA